MGAPSNAGSGFVDCLGQAQQIRVSDIRANCCSHRSRSFAVTDQQARTAENRSHGRGGYLRRNAPSGISAQRVGDRPRHVGRHVDMPYLASERRRQSCRPHCGCGCARNASMVLRGPSFYRDRPRDCRGLADKFRSQGNQIVETDSVGDRAGKLASAKVREIRNSAALKGGAKPSEAR